jgi:hypothetical protein
MQRLDAVLDLRRAREAADKLQVVGGGVPGMDKVKRPARNFGAGYEGGWEAVAAAGARGTGAGLLCPQKRGGAGHHPNAALPKRPSVVECTGTLVHYERTVRLT